MSGQHNSGWIPQKISNFLRTKTGETVGPELTDLTPVVLIQPDPIVTNALGTGATTTLITTASDRDTYVVSAQLTSAQDGTSDNIASYIELTQNGALKRILQLTGITLVAKTQDTSVHFGPLGIKADRNTAITVKHSGTVGTTRVGGMIAYYTTD
jgi:hypothetical protein